MITIVIPVKQGDDCDTTLWSLWEQTYKNFKIIIIPDQNKGANWARNQGFKIVDTKYVLFSDNDIQWHTKGIWWLYETLKRTPKASYSYGSWKDNRGELSFEEFDPEELKKRNYISTMSLIKTKDFCGFDEEIKRLQDWDVWLTMLKQGKTGIQCGKQIFTTRTNNGITKDEGYWEAKKIICKKHELPFDKNKMM